MIGNGLQILISNNGASQVTTIAVAVSYAQKSYNFKLLTGCVYFSIGKISWVSFFCLLYWFWSALGQRNRSCDALKAGVKASLFLCVNCIFKNAWMSADIGRSACRSCGIHGKSPWRVNPVRRMLISGIVSLMTLFQFDSREVWRPQRALSPSKPDASQLHHLHTCYRLKAPAVSSTQHYYDSSFNYSTVHKDRNVCIAYFEI